MIKKTLFKVLILLTLVLSACSQQNDRQTLHVATSAEYPPFEYQVNGVIKGFDIDLANLIANRLGKQLVIDNLQFSSILPALSGGQVDVAIATITITDERKKNFDFTIPYYFEGIAAVFRKESPINNAESLQDKKIACQLGSTMEIWLKKNFPDQAVIAMNYNNQAIETLKAGHVDVVLIDGTQGAVFSQKNPELSYAIITQSKDGYGLALRKKSPLTGKINLILKQLEAEGEIEKLKTKWLGGI
jgi:polar amino acid transport system substrate-binding protein